MLLFFAGGSPALTVLPLDFTTGTLPYGVSAAGGVNGTRTNSSGVIVATAPRLDYAYNGSGYAAAGILSEPASANLLTYSRDFSSGWSFVGGGGALTQSTWTTPDGATGATMTAGTGANSNLLRSSYGWLSLPYALSVYVKQNTHRYFGLRISNSDNSGSYAYIDLLTGTVNDAGRGDVFPSAVSLGGGVWRFTIVHTPTAGANNLVDLAIVSSSGAANAGSWAGTESVYIFGVQAEQASAASTYIPTVAGSVIRSADEISFTLPSGVTSLLFTFDDNSTQTVSGLTAGSLYTVPTTLGRVRIKTIANPSGGTVYNDVISEPAGTAGESSASRYVVNGAATESAASGESSAPGLVAPVTRTESAAATESSVGIFSGASVITETAAATESSTGTAPPFSSTITETVAATEASATAYTSSPAITETATAGESSATAYTTNPTITESATAAESSAPGLQAPAAITETAAAGESSTGTAPPFSSTITETAAATEASAATQALAAAATETAAATESSAPKQTIPVTRTESVAANDNPASTGSFGAAQTETAAATEASVLGLAPTSVAIEETAAASESVITNLSALVSISEFLFFTDIYTVTGGSTPGGVATFGVSDGSVSDQFPTDTVSYPYGTSMRVA